MAHANGGDPIRGLKWCRKTPAKIAQELQKVGIQVGASTVSRLLKKLLGYSLRVNHKTVESGNKNPPKPKERDQQFDYISDRRKSFARRGNPIISVDTKKKELIGNFKNDGQAWTKEPEPVNDHDFPSDALGRIVPYGIYDTQANRGWVCVGTSAETPALAVDAIEKWWREEGRTRYPRKTELLIQSRLRRRKRFSLPRLEIPDTKAAMRCPRTHGDDLSLSPGGLQMESNRAPTVF